MKNPDRFMPHQHQPDRLLAAGDVVVTEISTTFWGYSDQIRASFSVAAEPTPHYLELYETAEVACHRVPGPARCGMRESLKEDEVPDLTPTADALAVASPTLAGYFGGVCADIDI